MWSRVPNPLSLLGGGTDALMQSAFHGPCPVKIGDIRTNQTNKRMATICTNCRDDPSYGKNKCNVQLSCQRKLPKKGLIAFDDVRGAEGFFEVK